MPAALIATCAAALLIACGGGGGDSTATSAPAAASGSNSNSSINAVATASCGLANFQAAAMARINDWRARGATCGARGAFAPAPALAWNNRLTEAAAVHSNDMVTANFFDHTGSGGSTAGSRVTAAGYNWRTVGENIAAGYPTVNAVVDGWIGSEGHCANLLNAAFTEVGLACVTGTAANPYGTYWTMDLARPF
jgi:uncharacterized protein YkwD